MDVQNGCPKVQKKSSKKSSKNNYTKITNCWREGRGGEGWGGWRIVIPMPEAINQAKSTALAETTFNFCDVLVSLI
jgi:hypothetical protein